MKVWRNKCKPYSVVCIQQSVYTTLVLQYKYRAQGRAGAHFKITEFNGSTDNFTGGAKIHQFNSRIRFKKVKLILLRIFEDVRCFLKSVYPSVNLPKVFSQAATYQRYFPKWQLPRCAISQAATSQVCPSRSTLVCFRRSARHSSL